MLYYIYLNQEIINLTPNDLIISVLGEGGGAPGERRTLRGRIARGRREERGERNTMMMRLKLSVSFPCYCRNKGFALNDEEEE